MAKLSFSLFSILVSLTLCFSVLTDAQAGKIYRWVDKHGKTHFSQTPPNGDMNEYDVRFAKEKSQSEPVAEAKTKGDSEAKKGEKDNKNEKSKQQMTPQQRLAEIEKARADQAKVATEAAKKRDEMIKKCQKAQSSMRNIDQGGRIYDINDKGEREYWDDSKRVEKKAQAQELIDKYCN